MAYQQSSSSFYQSSSNGFDGGFGGQENYSSSSSSSSFGEGGNVAAATTTTRYATDAQGLFQDPNPQIIRRANPESAQSYIQRVVVKFLQPPPLPPPGPLIIKEVRPPQPPAPPPLYIRQRPPPPPTLPPVVIRESPPKMPPPIPTQVITKVLPALPVPPRSVIIERLPPLPPKPRDLIVERWLPYRVQQKRRVIIQRAPPAVVPKPRNIIIYYEAPKAQVVRRFQNLGVQRANPSEYVARYGTQLEDAQSLITQARNAGVVEDISPPGEAANSSNFQSGDFGAGFAGGAVVDAGAQAFSSNSYESSSVSYGAAEGVDSSFADLNLGGSTNYQTFSQ